MWSGMYSGEEHWAPWRNGEEGSLEEQEVLEACSRGEEMLPLEPNTTSCPSLVSSDKPATLSTVRTSKNPGIKDTENGLSKSISLPMKKKLTDRQLHS